MLKFKPIRELTDDDIKAMTADDLNAYDRQTDALVQEDGLTYNTKRQKYNDVALVLKGRPINYKQYQIELYELKQEIDSLKMALLKRQEDLVQLRRDWNRLHNTNQVLRAVISTSVSGKSQEVLMP